MNQELSHENDFQTQTIIEDSALLLGAALPDLYRINAFRISGLPIDATTRDISKQVDKLKMLKKYAGKEQNVGGVLALNPSPDEESIREAMQRLRDPERRIVDELFWFWPHQLGQSKNDEALKALAENDIKKANALWVKQESMSSDANVSMHNLAVLSHLIALDLEYKRNSNDLSERDITARDHFWKEAFKRWRILLVDEGFWSRFTSRIRQLDDPRLTTGTARRIRESLPLALLLINANLAVHASEANSNAEAKRHLKILNSSGFDEAIINEALRRTVDPIRKRIKTLCKSAKEDDDKPRKVFQNSTQLINQTESLLTILDAVLPTDHPTREGAHDEVALTALSNIIYYANETENWKHAVKILKKVFKLAVSESARERIQKNTDIFKRNVEYDLEYKTCFFCNPKYNKCQNCGEVLELEEEERNKQNFTCPSCNKINDMTDHIDACKDEDAVEVPMHGNVQQDNYNNRITWKYLNVKVPRCETCKNAHKRIDNFSIIGGFIGGLIGLGGCVSIMNANSKAWFGGLIVMGIITAIFVGLGNLIAKNKTQPDMKPESHKNNFSEVKALLDKGWGFGERPSEANQ